MQLMFALAWYRGWLTQRKTFPGPLNEGVYYMANSFDVVDFE